MSALTLNITQSGRFNLPGRTLFLTGLFIALFALAPHTNDLLIYDRDAVISGEWWRLLTGQFIHIGIGHLFWDVSAFLMLATLVEPEGRKSYWGLLACATIPVGLFIYQFMPHITYYAGLSGALNTLFVVTTYDLWKRDGGWLAPLLMIGHILKILIELWTQTALFTQTLWPPVPEVHAAGFMVGIIWLIGRNRYLKNSRNSHVKV